MKSGCVLECFNRSSIHVLCCFLDNLLQQKEAYETAHRDYQSVLMELVEM